MLGQSGCTEDDQITILNIIITAVVPLMLPKEGDSPQDAADKEEFLAAFNEALTNPDACHDCQEGLFLTMSPKQFLFEG